MASFRTHISWGIACGALSVFLLVGSAFAPLSWSFFLFLWLMVTLGAILPDMDSDSGIPFHITFGSLSIIAGGLAFFVTYDHAESTVPTTNSSGVVHSTNGPGFGYVFSNRFSISLARFFISIIRSIKQHYKQPAHRVKMKKNSHIRSPKYTDQSLPKTKEFPMTPYHKKNDTGIDKHIDPPAL